MKTTVCLLTTVLLLFRVCYSAESEQLPSEPGSITQQAQSIEFDWKIIVWNEINNTRQESVLIRNCSDKTILVSTKLKEKKFTKPSELDCIFSSQHDMGNIDSFAAFLYIKPKQIKELTFMLQDDTTQPLAMPIQKINTTLYMTTKWGQDPVPVTLSSTWKDAIAFQSEIPTVDEQSRKNTGHPKKENEALPPEPPIAMDWRVAAWPDDSEYIPITFLWFNPQQEPIQISRGFECFNLSTQNRHVHMDGFLPTYPTGFSTILPLKSGIITVHIENDLYQKYNHPTMEISMKTFIAKQSWNKPIPFILDTHRADTKIQHSSIPTNWPKVTPTQIP